MSKSKLIGEVVSKNGDIERLQERVAARDEELRQTKIKLRDAEARIAQLGGYIKELEAELAEEQTP